MRRDGGAELRYHDLRFPLAPGTTTHDEQHYRLVNWHEADDNLNYRRFFAVNSLAAVRVEDPEVFAETHVEIRRWFDEGLVDGLRVDHPDGLRDPKRYLDDLALLTGGAYVLVEKILEPGESLPTDWATQGTTGYDALGLVDRVLTDPAGQEPLDPLEARLRGGPVDWAEMIHGTKREVADGILHSEVRRITREVRRMTTAASFKAVEDAIAELLACFPVYRSYLPEGLDHLEEAFALAREHRPDLAATYDVLHPILSDGWSPPARRFQQTSGMVMAKGVEDCAFYRYSRLTSLNEVGGDPSVFSVTVDEFHAAMATRQAEWPHAMTTLSTHDTKRGEDVRARITALAELPDVWAAASTSCSTLAPVPDPGFGSLLWQAILGAWPASPDPDRGAPPRLRREGDARGRRPHHVDRARRGLRGRRARRGRRGLRPRRRAPRARRPARRGRSTPAASNALAAKLVAITMPGVPDVYQGSELWEQILVDPDNRRFVDFDHRAAVLAGTADDDAAAKLRLTRAALTLRRDRPELFTTYAPVSAARPGRRARARLRPRRRDHRGHPAAGRARAAGGWGDTTLDAAARHLARRPTGVDSATAGCSPISSPPTRSPCWSGRTHDATAPSTSGHPARPGCGWSRPARRSRWSRTRTTGGHPPARSPTRWARRSTTAT